MTWTVSVCLNKKIFHTARKLQIEVPFLSAYIIFSISIQYIKLSGKKSISYTAGPGTMNDVFHSMLFCHKVDGCHGNLTHVYID